MQDSTMLFMDLIALGCAVFCAYTWLRLLKERKLFQNSLLVPKDKKVSECRDEAGYVSYLLPRLGILTLLLLIYAAFSILNDRLATPLLGHPWAILPLVGVFAVLIWYAVVSAKAFRNYFE